MEEKVAIKICEQMTNDIDNLCNCPRQDKNKTCIGCKELAIATILQQNKELQEEIKTLKEIICIDNLKIQQSRKNNRIEVKELQDRIDKVIKYLKVETDLLKENEYEDEALWAYYNFEKIVSILDKKEDE